ncbi:MAG: hypothetical protein ABSF13_14200 [Smithella sp.]|jgi:hypothetical protein
MHLPLPYYPLIAHWVPGFVTLSFFVYPFFMKQGADFNPSAGMAVITIFFFTALSFVIGQIIDAFRNAFLEDIIDKFAGKFDWESFAKNKDERLESLYFIYYVFDINFITGLTIGSIYLIINPFDLYFPCSWKIIFAIVIVLISLLLGKDAKVLRKEMADVLKDSKPL